MSDLHDNPDGDAEVSQPAVGDPLVSAGQLLRRAREASGLHIAALAVSLKVPVKKLEALEADRFDLLPDAVFVRALASSVCRTLKIDSSQVLERLPQTHAPKLTYQGAGINAPFRAPGDGPGPSWWTQVSTPAVWAGLILVIGALVLVLLPAVKKGAAEAVAQAPAPGGETTRAGDAVVMGQPGNPESVKSGNGEAALLPAPPAVPAIPETPSRPAIPLASVSSPKSQASAPAGASFSSAALAEIAPAVPPVAAASAAPTASGIVVFSARGESWVEVTDAKGVVVLRRTLGAGEVVGASGALPMTAVVGKADATQVQVRGKALDLASYARDNVARFEVK
jgi:cytoskeleton protein RodZ